jgi:hypothetical protein
MSLTRNALHTTAALVLALALAATAPAIASAATEQQQGAQLLSEVQGGRLRGTNLTSTQYQHVGQYLMGRALGSSQRYETMDSQMDRVMGQSVSDQMYLYMGERYLGKSVAPNSSYAPYYSWMANVMSRYGGAYAGMMGGYMMGAYNSLSGQGSATGGYHMGPGMMGHGYASSSQNAADSGMSTSAIIAIVLGAIGVVGLLVVLLRGVTGRRAPKAGAA